MEKKIRTVFTRSEKEKIIEKSRFITYCAHVESDWRERRRRSMDGDTDVAGDAFGDADGVAGGSRKNLNFSTGSASTERFISQEDVKRLQNFYWDKYKVRLSYKEAEQILLVEMKDKKPAPPAPRGPQKPFKK